jgi:hypothetical protein
VEPSKDTNGNEHSRRPWILSAAYWNDVAKDVVKAASAALVIYLGGVVAGVFRIHLAILAIVVIFAITIIVYVTIFAIGMKGKQRPGLASLVTSAGGAGTAQFITVNWHIAGIWWYLLITAGYSAVLLVVSFWIIDHLIEK